MNTIKCPRCNLTNWASDKCKRCGFLFDASQSPFEGGIPPADLGTRPDPEPYTHRPVIDQQYNSAGSISANGQPKTGLAIASMVCSICAFALCFVTGPVGLVLGIVALIKESKRPTEYGGRGFALAGVILGAMSTLFIPIVAAIAIPNLLAARRSANEGSAISSIRTLGGAESTYQATSGAGQCGDLTQLAAANLIDPRLGSGQKSGYGFVMKKTSVGCEVSAIPITSTGVSATGSRSFYATSDEGWVIHHAPINGLAADRRAPVIERDRDGYPDQSYRPRTASQR